MFLLPAWKREGEGREEKEMSVRITWISGKRKAKGVKIKKVDLRLHHDAVASAPVFSGMRTTLPPSFHPVIVA